MGERVVAVTGGHGVLGRAVVEAALARGWRVAVIDHAMGHSAPDGALEIGGVDLTDPAQADAAVGRVVERFGDRVFEAVINRTVRFPETTVAGEPITTYASSSAGAASYRMLAKEVLQRCHVA